MSRGEGKPIDTRNKPLGVVIICPCGCNRGFTRRNTADKYYCEGCRIKAYNARQRGKGKKKK